MFKNVILNLIFSSGQWIGSSCEGEFQLNHVTNIHNIELECATVQFTPWGSNKIKPGDTYILVNGEEYGNCSLHTSVTIDDQLELFAYCPGIPL